jgi:hypothetical protein
MIESWVAPNSTEALVVGYFKSMPPLISTRFLCLVFSKTGAPVWVINGPKTLLTIYDLSMLESSLLYYSMS